MKDHLLLVPLTERLVVLKVLILLLLLLLLLILTIIILGTFDPSSFTTITPVTTDEAMGGDIPSSGINATNATTTTNTNTTTTNTIKVIGYGQ